MMQGMERGGDLHRDDEPVAETVAAGCQLVHH